MKEVREMGLERRETVRSLTTTNVRKLKKFDLSTRGAGNKYLLCISYITKCIAK